MPTEPTMNERIACKVMGREVTVPHDGIGELWPRYWRGTAKRHSWKTHFIDYEMVPDFEHSLDACVLAEKRIEELGLWGTYQMAINHAWWAARIGDSTEFLIRLTPEQRCQAMLAAVATQSTSPILKAGQ